jgi:hypothetical protein
MSPANLRQSETTECEVLSRSKRKRLLSLAYGYLGSFVESKDIVQEALLRFEQADRASILNAEAWLTTVVTRLSIDKLRFRAAPAGSLSGGMASGTCLPGAYSGTGCDYALAPVGRSFIPSGEAGAGTAGCLRAA